MTLIVARHTSQPLRESDFDNPFWRASQSIRIEHYWSGEPASPARHAEARICWSDEALHVRFVGVQREPLIVSDNPQTEK